jgi:hypothetical protein
MKARKLAMVFALIMVAGGFGATRGLAHMQQTYNGVCGQLTGVPGILQKMHFFAQGNCRVSGTQCHDSAACTITSPSGTVMGKCTNTPAGCTCVAK